MHTDTGTFKVVRDTSIQNERWYFIGRDSTARELLTNRTDGLSYMVISSTGTIVRDASLFAKYPANVNDVWISVDSCTAKLNAKDLPISVPQGSYSCYNFTYADKYSGFVIQSKYFALGIGIGFVRDDFYSKRASGLDYVTYRRELTGLSLNKSSATATQGKETFRDNKTDLWFNPSALR